MKVKTTYAAVLVSIAAAAIALLFSAGSASAQELRIGVVDLRQVAESHPIYKQWEQQFLLTKAEEERKMEAELKQKYNLPEDPTKATLTEDQKKEIQQFIYERNQAFTQSMQQSRDMKMQEVEDSIIENVKKVATAKGLAMVVDSAVVLMGGEDITAAVIEEIGKTAAQPAPAPAGGNK